MSTWLRVALGMSPTSLEKDPLLSCLTGLGKAVLKKHPYVNDGGCCVYASNLAAELLRRKIDARIIVASGHARVSGANIDRIRSYLPKPASMWHWNEHEVNFHHVAVEFVYRGAVYHHDSKVTAEYTDVLDNMPIYQGRLTVEEAKYLADNSRGWNDMFDRTQIPSIQRLITRHMGLYDFKLRKKQMALQIA